MSDPVPRLATGSTGAGDLILASDSMDDPPFIDFPVPN
jgi:hypothetical protein